MKTDFKKLIKMFQNNKTGNIDKFFVHPNAIVFKNAIKENGKLESVQETVAIRTNQGIIIGNAERLEYVERKVAFGRVVRRWNNVETEIQRELAKTFTMLPFNVFRQAKLNLFSLEMLEDSGPETISVKRSKYNHKKEKTEYFYVNQHFTGAKLFSVPDKQGNKSVYLFDIDRREIKHGIMNPFLVKLKDDTVKTIKDAYESLKPDAVKQAEKAGIEVLRQGEWFFIKTAHAKDDFTAKQEYSHWEEKNVNSTLTLRAGPNRPNYVSEYVELGKAGYLVSGTVEHSGREHEKLTLDGWFIPIANTAQESVTIMGDVD